MTTVLRPNKRRGLAFRLALLILTSTTILFLAAFGYNYYYSRQLVLKNVRAMAMNLAQATVQQIESKLRAVEMLPRMMAHHLEANQDGYKPLLPLLHDMVAASPEIFGSAAAFEPYAFDPEIRFFAPYFFHTQGSHLAFTQLGSDTYNYFLWDWYLIPKELNQPVWSEPYFDEGGGGILMATYSHPFYNRSAHRQTFGGVVTADISLEALVAEIASIALYETGYAFLLSRNGLFLAHPENQRILRESIFSVAAERNQPELRAIGRKMVQGQRGFTAVTSVHTGERSLLAYAPVSIAGWSVGVMIPEHELFSDLRALNHTVLLIGIAGFALLFAAVVSISRSITRPLHALVRTTSEIARGNLEVRLPSVRTGDEVQVLSRSVDEMRLALKEYIAHLTETTRAKERIESELKIARTIQMSFLPKRFPPFSDQTAFDLFAALEPAKEVGGDLYDFFMLDERHLFFSVGDVSDKGVPAALFMAVTKTLIKGIAERNVTPADVLARVNTELCIGNDSAMFVTVACGMLNIETGVLAYSNAGHNPPVLVARGRVPEPLPMPPGLVLGVMEEAAYETRHIRLHPGDRLVVYTDGVTEAMDAGQNLFTEERLLETVATFATADPQGIVEGIMTAVHAHAAGTPQSDDITLLALHFRGMPQRPTPR